MGRLEIRGERLDHPKGRMWQESPCALASGGRLGVESSCRSWDGTAAAGVGDWVSPKDSHQGSTLPLLQVRL